MKFENGDFYDIYDVKEKLGHGHFAEVKRCILKRNESEFAIKFIRKRQIYDAKHLGMSHEDIEREANILHMLDHQNIIKLHYCYDLKKNVALVLELVSGGELFEYISDSEKLSEEEASEFIEQILLGVRHMHDKKVVHLDLKPENVMIEDLDERKIKLIDFGLAREIKNKNTAIEMQGTAEFLAPEVINYDPISYATDMWAIGVISYIMLTGISPFSGEDQTSTFQNIVNCRLDFDPDICGDMTEMARSFIKSILVPNPKKRATAKELLVHSWIKPKEPAFVVRRRSSIISRDKLLSLKHYVMSPSPPDSESVTPIMGRKIDEVREVSEENSSPRIKQSRYNMETPRENGEVNSESDRKNLVPDINNLAIDNIEKKEELTGAAAAYNELCSESVKAVPKPTKTGNILTNSVRKWNSKLESLFESKTSITEYSSGPRRKGSLKNALRLQQPVSPAPQSSHSLSGSNSRQISASAATSPTLLKKSVFFARYMDAVQSKKK